MRTDPSGPATLETAFQPLYHWLVYDAF
jgi:hypothetical protein